ncbi:hypothetical protein JCM3774_001011 [Rhodotorula dairenensis]
MATGVDSSADGPQWVVALLPARGHGRQVGVVALDSDSARVTVSHIAADSPTWVKSVHLARSTPPTVILLPATALAPAPAAAAAADPQVAMLVNALEVNFPHATLVPVIRKYWNEQASHDHPAPVPCDLRS